LSDLIKYDPSYNASQSTYLYNYVGFYRELSEKGKQKFLRRVQKFIRIKDFEFFFDPGREELLIKTLIAASCIQVTWGIQDTYINSYTYIGVYAEALKLQKGKGVVYSSIWLTKNVNFSWSKIKEGYIIPDDSKHIGLFEWTRALIIQARKDNIMDDFFSAYYKVWCEAARDIMFVVDEDINLPLDKFGQKLPVIVQHFFEQPEELQQNHPEIYEHTKRLLNIDPIDGGEYDFVYSKKLAAEKKIKTKNRVVLFGVQKEVRKFGLTSGIMYYILAQFPAVVFIWYMMGRWTYFSWSFVGVFTLITIMGAIIINKRYYRKRGLSRKALVAVFIIGLIPFVYGSMSLLNYYIPIQHHKKTVFVANEKMFNRYLPWKGFTDAHIIKMNFPPYDPSRGEFDVLNGMIKTYSQGINLKNLVYLMDGNDKVEVHTFTGIFGAEVYEGYEITLNR